MIITGNLLHWCGGPSALPLLTLPKSDGCTPPTARAVDPRVEAMSMTADGADQRLYTLSQSWVIGHTHQEIDRVHYSPGIYSDDESGRESKSC